MTPCPSNSHGQTRGDSEKIGLKEWFDANENQHTLHIIFALGNLAKRSMNVDVYGFGLYQVFKSLLAKKFVFSCSLFLC